MKAKIGDKVRATSGGWQNKGADVMKRRSYRAEGLGGCLAVVLYFGFIFGTLGCVGVFPLHYTVNHWLVFAGKDPALGWLAAFFLACLPPVTGAAVLGAVATFIISLFA